MKLRMTALSVMALVGIATSQSPDTTKKAAFPPLKAAEGVRFPGQSERFTLLGVAVVLIGGLGLILNEKRRLADKRLARKEGAD